MRRWFAGAFGPALAGLLLAAPPAVAQAQAQAQAPAERDPFAHFYAAPDLDRVPALLREAEAKGLLARPDAIAPIAGFLAGLFLQHPERIDGWLTEPYAAGIEPVLATALMLAGERGRAAAFVALRPWPGDVQARLLAPRPDLRVATILSPADLDALWGACFATGDPAYAARILDHVTDALGAGAAVGDLLLASDVAYTRTPEGQAAMQALRGRLDEAGLRRAVMGAAALWGLASNSGQHDFVRLLVERRIAEAPGSDLGYALARAGFRQARPLVVQGGGDGAKALVSFVADPGFSAAAAAAGVRDIEAVFRRYARNDFAIGEPVRVAVVLLLPAQRRVEYRVRVRPPAGEAFELGPFPVEAGATPRIEYGLVALDAARQTAIGAHEVELTVSDVGARWSVAHGFFLGRP